ncbi:carboxypeptidase regulatory-like domain-containing protein [Streptomyces katsurahamanus]|uniref:Carboxypeptidase regulatory-like domain-containing protein n=1 Tax=Streptomyces katsurahamanus TaxID=2577098 RepID=A0ABW9NVK7_9ACTN|nr:carboxypeptidase regulatory-like domain-containing protein [Streptomyces katsurahamanus]MQS37184.1 carboxypeptidase regulatory-like domain-containing protein [Streptomyces katsurahamanus]
MSRFLSSELPALYSPVWFVPFDEHARRVRAAGVTVRLDRFDDGEWLPLDDVAVRTPSAAIVFPGLGRRREPWAARPELHRARFAAAGYQPLYPADGRPFSAGLIGVEFLVHPYDDAWPPGGPAGEVAPRLVRLLPGTAFPYPPGTRTVYGVVRAAGTEAPVANALVEAAGETGGDRTPWRERTLSDAMGAFRLSLRWEGARDDPHTVDERFTLRAVERPGRTGSLTVRLPQEAERRHVIEIREQ